MTTARWNMRPVLCHGIASHQRPRPKPQSVPSVLEFRLFDAKLLCMPPVPPYPVALEDDSAGDEAADIVGDNTAIGGRPGGRDESCRLAIV